MPTLDEIIKKDTIYNINFKLLDSALMFDPITCLYAFLDDAEMEIPSYLPTGNDDENALAFLYTTSHSGEKYISNYVLRTYDIIKKLNPSATDGERYNYLIVTIGHTIFLKYNENWKRIYESLFADYNPIQNYDSTEEITRSGDDKTSVNTDYSQKEKVSAFNTSTMLDNRETTSNGLASNNYSKTDYNSKVKTTKSGNIGVTTSQQMIESELQLRKNKFYEILFNDCDEIFTNNLYFMKD